MKKILQFGRAEAQVKDQMAKLLAAKKQTLKVEIRNAKTELERMPQINILNDSPGTIHARAELEKYINALRAEISAIEKRIPAR